AGNRAVVDDDRGGVRGRRFQVNARGRRAGRPGEQAGGQGGGELLAHGGYPHRTVRRGRATSEGEGSNYQPGPAPSSSGEIGSPPASLGIRKVAACRPAPWPGASPMASQRRT